MAIDYKQEVISFFDNHVMKYIITDLEVLDNLRPNTNGEGACTVPQAISTFAAVDLMGFLIDPQSVGGNIVQMRLMPFLRNNDLFPETASITNLEEFLASFRDDIRSMLTHRFFPSKFDLAKLPETSLIIINNGRSIFNVSHFTKTVIKGIEKIYEKLKDETFVMPGDSSNSVTVERMYNRLEMLRNHQSPNYAVAAAESFPSTSLTTQTTMAP